MHVATNITRPPVNVGKSQHASRGRPGAEESVKGLLSVIVPVYNEERSIVAAIDAVLGAAVPLEIVVVDDGSTDGTATLLAHHRADNLRVIRHARNLGKGAAIRSALDHVKGEFVIIQDADLEYRPSDYPALLEPLLAGRANVVYGVRDDRPARGLSLFLAARMLTWIANALYGCAIHDEATGYKVFRRSVLERIALDCERFEFCPEVTAKACRLGERIYEVPISYYPRSRADGKKVRWTDACDAVWTLLKYRFAARATFDRELQRERLGACTARES